MARIWTYLSFDETNKFSPRANQCKYLMDSKVGNFDEHKLVQAACQAGRWVNIHCSATQSCAVFAQIEEYLEKSRSSQWQAMQNQTFFRGGGGGLMTYVPYVPGNNSGKHLSRVIKNLGPHSKYLSLVRTSTSKWIWANKSAMFGKAWTQMCHRMWVDMSHRWKHTLQHTIHSIASQDVTQDYSEWQDVTQSKAQVKNLGHPESVVFSALSCYLLHSCLDGIHGTWWF